MKKELSGLSGLFSELKKARRYKSHWKCKQCNWINPMYLFECGKCGLAVSNKYKG